MRYQNTLPAILVIAVTASSAAAQGALRAAPSTRATAAVTLDLADSAARVNSNPAMIKLDYGQPHLRGRTIHTDSVVPYDKVWRTGANAPTTLDTDVDLVIGGKAVPRGKYEVETLPSRNGWKLLLRKDGVQPPPQDAPYNPANYFAVIDLRAMTIPAPAESLTMALIPSRGEGPPRGELRIGWGTVIVSTDWSVR